MAEGTNSKMNIAIIHPDLGIGGAERLVVDAAVELASRGHKVHIFTAHHDKNRCFEETIAGEYLSQQSMWINSINPLPLSGFDKRLKENVEYLEELKDLAEKEGVSDKIKFITSCSTDERNALLSECLCVLYTPENEHFGIVPLEAMAAYKPVIACNSGGPVESIKNGVTGFLCDPTPQEFSSAMANLINDSQRAEKMGREARRHVVESFSTKTFGKRLNTYLVDIHRGKED
ncbi:sucrose synthase [Trifolium repens]|nr:sucrose synthase [Trifolium repens]